MQTPSPAQIHTAIEVFKKLGERVNSFAARSVSQIPSCGLSGQVAGQIGRNAMEQTKQVQEISGLLKNWHSELEHRQKHTPQIHV